jgi:hypothetical protein
VTVRPILELLVVVNVMVLPIIVIEKFFLGDI